MRPIVGGRRAEQVVPTQFELRGTIEFPEDDEMREALNVGEPRLKLGQDLEHTIGLVFSAKSLGNFAYVIVRTTHKSYWARGEHEGASLHSHTNAVARIRSSETIYALAPSQVAVGDIILNMTQEARELLQKALALPENERAELAGNLISSLDATVDQDVDAAWQQEVVRRLHEVQSGKVETGSWEEVQQKGRTLL